MPCRICGSRCHGDRCAECEREGQAVDQEPGDGRCSDCRDDVLPCLDCLVGGGGSGE